MELISDGVDKINSMKNRELERKMNVQKTKETKKQMNAENEQMDYFQKTFDEKQTCIESLLKQSYTLTNEELPEHFNRISKEILLLQKYIASSNLFLRNYFLQKCQMTLQELSTKTKDLENELLPKKRFGFKNKISNKKPVKSNQSDVVDSAASAEISKSYIPNIDCGFNKRQNEVLQMKKNEIAKRDVSLENLQNCQVYLEGSPSTLHLNHLTNCKVFCGPVSTSIFAEDCNDCTLIIACQQLRLHASRNVDIYLQVTSRAIMEDCTNISIAPYNWIYEGIEEDFFNAGLNRQVNNWRCIDDFNWLNVEEHSPHWKEMKEEDRVKEWT